MKNDTDTIAAVATPAGHGGIGVIRISGPTARKILFELTHKEITHKEIQFTSFFNHKQQILDQGLALYFHGPQSFTGEDVVEIHGHGGAVVLQSLLSEIIDQGARLAKPGEFSERAFLNGKIDLVQAEAIADLINSASETAARSAMRSLQGEFSTHINQLKEKIVHLRTYIEVLLDFSDEEISIDTQTLIQDAKSSLALTKEITRQANQGALLTEGVRLCIVGEPNVGKSSLLNALLKVDRAIVTDIPGTTRDTLTEDFLLNGVRFIITDTAGIRETEDHVEIEGIRRSHDSANKADIILSMRSASDEKSRFPEIKTTLPCLFVVNKIDQSNEKKYFLDDEKNTLYLSVKTGEGLDILKKELLRLAGLQEQTEGLFSARKRHLKSLEITSQEIEYALPYLLDSGTFDLAAENLRQAQQALSEITGEFTTEDLLGEIFSGFCIGK